MREIKFRVWDEVNKCWIKGFLVDERNQTIVKRLTENEFRNRKQDILEIGYPVILMQYTGLKDKNGDEIYEGDIVEESNRIILRGPDAGKPVPNIIKEVKWDNSNIGYNICVGPFYEIIGNEFDNPELLEDNNV